MSACHDIDGMLDLLDARELPDPCPDGVPCCDSYAYFGPTRCTCWEVVYDTEQAEPRTDLPTEEREQMCGDCAFRPGSPERIESQRAVAGPSDLLRCVIDPRQDFACHDGLRHGVAYRHPSGLTVPVRELDGVVPYHPPIIDGRAYRADGRPALRCAGLVAARKAKAWLP